MEEEQNQPETNPSAQQPVSPPQPMKKKGSKKTIVLVAIIMLIAVGIFLIVRGLGGQTEIAPSPTPSEEFFTPTPTETPAPIDKSEVKIEVLNGTGIAGEAAFLKGKLEGLGYSKIETGNADEQDNETTTVTFSASLSETAIDEITKELEDIYKDVSTSTSRSLEDFQVSIVTGLRKGQTPKPTATPKATVSPSPTASPTGSPTGSPTPTATH